MSDEPSKPPANSTPPASTPTIISSSELLQGRKELWIDHGGVLYRLRLTRSGKLILQK